jgi:hypothetical protein
MGVTTKMALCSLLRMGSTNTERSTFSFEHAMAHRTLYGAMSPISQFSVLPYELDPQRIDNGLWLLKHAQAHWDFLTTLPSYFQAVAGFPQTQISPETGGLGFAGDPILLSPNLDTAWSIFANHTAHLDAMSVYPEPQYLTFPFW